MTASAKSSEIFFLGKSSSSLNFVSVLDQDVAQQICSDLENKRKVNVSVSVDVFCLHNADKIATMKSNYYLRKPRKISL